jgi:hypothetical protein
VKQAESAAKQAQAELDAAHLNVQTEHLKDVAAAITKLTAKPSPDATDEAALLTLLNYTKEPESRTAILRALEVRLATPLRTAGEEIASVRLGEAMLPDSFDVLVDATRKANVRAIELRWAMILQATESGFREVHDADQTGDYCSSDKASGLSQR